MHTLRHTRRKPTHPGAILREDVLPALDMTQGEFARRLGVSRLTVSDLLHEKRALSAEMAARLGKLLDTTPESWLAMQTALDLWAVAQDTNRLAGVEPIRPEDAALRLDSSQPPVAPLESRPGRHPGVTVLRYSPNTTRRRPATKRIHRKGAA
ncbi:HigA family addiction module antitoxin [Immundisolibacter sp.]|uniref:HigA family addiction module antitoxin n=1 Tax=Immundisolibacter sp. TaxID=1934948 RepID=UPI00356294C4